MNSQFNCAFKGPGINQILSPNISVMPATSAIPTESNNNLFNAFLYVALIGLGVFIIYKVSESITQKKDKLSRNIEA